MPRPLLKNDRNIISESSILSNIVTPVKNKQKSKLSQMQMDRLLRKKRSQEYMDALHKLDAGGHCCNQSLIDEIMDAISKEFDADLNIHGILLGYVSICYLGEPYEVHTLDPIGGIIQHYKVGQTLPNGLEKARGIALRGGYEFIEVYIDCCRAVDISGNVSVIRC